MEVVSAWGALSQWYQHGVLCGGGISMTCSVRAVSVLGALCRWYQQEVLY